MMSLSDQQLQRIQENKMKALAMLANKKHKKNKQKGSQAILISVDADENVFACMKKVRWSDMSGGSLTMFALMLLASPS